MVRHSSSHTGACLPLSRHVGRQSSTGNIDTPVPNLLPAIVTSPPNEATPPLVEISSQLSLLGLTGIPPVTRELNEVASTGFLRIADHTQANRRRSGDSPSSRSQPLPEIPLLPDIPALVEPSPFQSSIRATAHNFSASSAASSDYRRVDSSSSQSSSSTSGTSKLRRQFGNKMSNSSLRPGAAPSRNRTTSAPTKKDPKTAALQPSRSVTLSIDIPQSRNWEPVNPVVLGFMEMAASESECLLRVATDGTVCAANLEGLVSRVITDIEYSSRNDHFRATFLTIYQLFATSERLFDILKRRFGSSELDLVGARSRYPYVRDVLLSNEY